MKRIALLLTMVLAAGLSSAPPARAADGAGSVRFVTPGRFATSVGPSTATLDVDPPAGATIVSVAFIADGVPLGTSSSPPWSFAWEAGDGTAEHKLDAVAKFSNGTEARASVALGRRIAIDTEIAAPVKIYAIARGAKGEPVDDLGPGEVHLVENGRPQALEQCTAERGPLRIAIVLDTSASMKGERLTSAIASAIDFLDVLRTNDEALVVSFADQVSIVQEPTSDRKKLEGALRSVAARGGSSLYDAIYAGSDRLAAFSGRRVLLLLTDGRDEAADGRRGASVHTLEQARDRAIRNDVMVFTIGLGNYLAHDAQLLAEGRTTSLLEVDLDRRQSVAAILSSLSTQTGGAIVYARGPEQTRRGFERFAEDLRHQYILKYYSSEKQHDDTWREVKVVVDRPGVSLTSRTGYFAK